MVTCLAAPVVNGNVRDGCGMTSHLSHLSVGAALPQQDVPLKAPTSTQTEGLAVGKAVHPSAVCSHCVQHLAPGQVRDFDGAVQGACHQAQLMDIGHLYSHQRASAQACNANHQVAIVCIHPKFKLTR